MNTLADYGDESDEDSPRRRSFGMERSEVLANASSQPSNMESPKAQQTDSDHSPPRPRKDSDAMFDEDTMFDEPRRYSSFSDNSDHSDTVEFREPPPPKRKEYHSPSPSIPTPSSKIHQVSSAISLVSYGGAEDEDKEDAFERADRYAESAQSPSSPPSGIVEPRPPGRKSDTDDENERLIDMALEEGRNALKQVVSAHIEDAASTGSGGWTPRPYDSPLHGLENEVDTKRIDTPPHQDVTIPPAPTTECDPEVVQIFYKHFERKAAGIDVNISVQERKDFQNPSSYEQLILNFGINEVATLLHPRLLTVDYPRCCRYEKIAEDQRKYMESINAAKNAKNASGQAKNSSSHSLAAALKKKA